MVVHKGIEEEVDTEHCHFWGFFGISIQIALGLMSFSALIVKRYRESPRRTWLVFGLDSSKQAIGAGMAHGLNLIFAEVLGAEKSNPCEWYFLHVMIDGTLGILFNLGFLKLLEKLSEYLSSRYGYVTLHTGDYGDPPSYVKWGKQLLMWLLVVVLTKGVLVGLAIPLAVYLEYFAELSLMPFKHIPKFKLVFVMIIIPVVMNCIQFWVTDSILKKKTISSGVDTAVTAASSIKTTYKSKSSDVDEEIMEDELANEKKALLAKDNGNGNVPVKLNYSTLTKR
eukprot:GILJ01003263.1.p1 GENE.GILJ01003263.1~~GILJ01003263.1.p1  ORF type:complete len:315 (-),score=34.18 GILJ01003263.1:262-1107(-)